MFVVIYIRHIKSSKRSTTSSMNGNKEIDLYMQSLIETPFLFSTCKQSLPLKNFCTQITNNSTNKKLKKKKTNRLYKPRVAPSACMEDIM